MKKIWIKMGHTGIILLPACFTKGRERLNGETPMNLKELRIGTRLELHLLDASGEKVGYNYVSQILDILEGESLLLAYPIFESRMVFIPTGAQLRLIFLHHKYGLLSVLCTVLSKDKKDNFSFLTVKIAGDFEKIQRRKYYRLDCNLDILFRVLENYPEHTEVPPTDSGVCKAITKNLSGSGICIVSDKTVEPGAYLEVRIFLEAGNPIKAIGVVTRCLRMEGIKLEKYEIGLHLIELGKKEQDAIVKHIFAQQRVLLKKNILE